jgi:hypothetical protein
MDSAVLFSSGKRFLSQRKFEIAGFLPLSEYLVEHRGRAEVAFASCSLMAGSAER